ncbi:predicted protein [Naegleria gruberi]|uniref:Predicted protein n=1 Tax=Naegleria gruberi TaxID=5762 RepID=D2W5Z7_NAEGR|nr:uncharacterized protein NAEGRDRAFT_82367 [Naegleria gruberi]EFC35506.1 predicted protein [Naegleria gruberi]|eukprot:XP_002668250.1 predicted protein [Naegleria gruberi strain NEG-M]
MVLESVLSEDNKVYSDAKSYCQLLLTCAIACEISYMPDPLYTLNKEYSQFEHGIKKLCSSITNDMDAKATLETRYVVADCSDENRKRIVVAIRGSYSKSDILTDVKLIPAMNYYGYGVLHSGFLERAKFIPLDYFLEKINEGYQVVITGHSMGGAVGAILATRLMQATEAKAIKKPPIQFIGFGVPLLADVKFKERILKDEQSNYFHFYINEKDCVPRSISIVSEIISLSAESDLIDQVSNFLKTVVSAISSITGRVHRAEIINSGISVFQWFSKVIAKVIHKYAPQFSPFGNHIHISYSNNKQIYDDNAYILDHWSEVFGKGSTIGWVSVSERKKVLRVLKSACINYQIRQELMKNFYVGVVGMKKCGKSTFVEKFLHRNANASSIIATTEIQAYPLTSNSSNFAVWDFPHYESQDHLHKVQFITSRFLLDYIVVVYDALSKCDKEECKEHINVIKQSNDHRFIVLMNKADALYKPNMNMTKDHFDDTRRECSLKLGVDISRVILTSVDPAINNIHQLKPWGVNMMSEIRDVIWEDLKTTAKRTVAEVEQEWNSLKKYDALKVSIEFRRKGKNSSFCFSWDKLKNLQFRELVEELKNEFDYDNIKITTKNSLEEISDMQQLLEHEDHEFIVEKQ